MRWTDQLQNVLKEHIEELKGQLPTEQANGLDKFKKYLFKVSLIYSEIHLKNQKS